MNLLFINSLKFTDNAKHIFTKYIKVFRFIFYPLYVISLFTPRNKNIWLFGASQNRFSENSKALFKYAIKANSEVKCVWITGDKRLYFKLKSDGYRVCIRWSLKGVYYSLIAKYYFYNSYSDDINYYTSGNAIMVNLWHGIPLKKIEFDIEKGILSKVYNSNYSTLYRFLKPYSFKKPNFVLSTSKTVSKLFSSAFRISKESCLELGYPRCDILYDKPKLNSNMKYIIESKNRIIVYMPTWRSENREFLDDAILNYDDLNSILIKRNSTMLIKMHPNSKTIVAEYSNIKILDSKIDIYSILPYSDTLITDYSSIYFDYLLLDKEIIFYPFDYSLYLDKDRELYFDYSKFTPGKTVYTFESLLMVLSDINKVSYKEERDKLKNTLWKYQDNNASQRVYEYFYNKIKAD